MHERIINRLEESCEELLQREDELSEKFYATLFAENPGLRLLFSPEAADKRRGLLLTLALAISNLRVPQPIQRVLVGTCCQQAEWRLSDEQYAIYRNTLISVMLEMMGSAWDRTLSHAWREALDAIARPAAERAPQRGNCRSCCEPVGSR